MQHTWFFLNIVQNFDFPYWMVVYVIENQDHNIHNNYYMEVLNIRNTYIRNSSSFTYQRNIKSYYIISYHSNIASYLENHISTSHIINLRHPVLLAGSKNSDEK